MDWELYFLVQNVEPYGGLQLYVWIPMILGYCLFIIILIFTLIVYFRFIMKMMILSVIILPFIYRMISNDSIFDNQLYDYIFMVSISLILINCRRLIF